MSVSVPWFITVALAILIASILYALSTTLEGLLIPLVGTSAVAVWLAVAFIEETPKYFVVANGRFLPGLAVILALGTLETTVYALVYESRYGVGLTIGVVFWYVTTIRFIFGGHLMYYLSGIAATRTSNRALPTLASTGRNFNAIGWVVAVTGHFAWNYSIYAGGWEWIVLILAAYSLVGLYFAGALPLGRRRESYK